MSQKRVRVSSGPTRQFHQPADQCILDVLNNQTPGSDFNNFDWLSSQNGGQFDPVLFGDYRESQDNILGTGDFSGGFFDEAIPPLDDSLFNDFMPAPAKSPVQPQPAKRPNLMEQVEQQRDGTDTDAFNEIMMNKIEQKATKMMTCPEVWYVALVDDSLSSARPLIISAGNHSRARKISKAAISTLTRCARILLQKQNARKVVSASLARLLRPCYGKWRQGIIRTGSHLQLLEKGWQECWDACYDTTTIWDSNGSRETSSVVYILEIMVICCNQLDSVFTMLRPAFSTVIPVRDPHILLSPSRVRLRNNPQHFLLVARLSCNCLYLATDSLPRRLACFLTLDSTALAGSASRSDHLLGSVSTLVLHIK